MLVKIGNQVFDPEQEPIMLILTEQDKVNIQSMLVDATRYACFPTDWGTSDDKSIWMDSLPESVLNRFNIEPEWTPWRYIESSNLSAVKFKPNQNTGTGWLEVKFKSGDIYRYEGVPVWVLQDLVNPELEISKGQYFQKSVKEGGYKFEKVVN